MFFIIGRGKGLTLYMFFSLIWIWCLWWTWFIQGRRNWEFELRRWRTLFRIVVFTLKALMMKIWRRKSIMTMETNPILRVHRRIIRIITNQVLILLPLGLKVTGSLSHLPLNFSLLEVTVGWDPTLRFKGGKLIWL